MEITSYGIEERNQLPDEPGVYRFYTTEDQLIYVGKAKSLKKRVASYFNKSANHSRKTAKMVKEVAAIRIDIVNSEFDALLLENSLIKKNQPRYNILLKDDKTYPYICITKERYPRIYPTRRVNTSTGQYFGPYASVKAMHALLELLHQLFTLRTCKFSLTEKNVEAGKFKVCLEYHIKNCKGPCEGLQPEDEYNQDIEQAKHILKGNLGQVKGTLENEMSLAAQALAFEKAQEYKIKLDLLGNFQAKSTIVNPKIPELDVCTIVSTETSAFVNYIIVRNGAIVNTKTTEVRKRLDEPDEAILSSILAEMRQQFNSAASLILTNIQPSILEEGVEHVLPKIGDKRKLVDLSLKNALFAKKEKLESAQSNAERENRVLSTLQSDLQLKSLPLHIECFDNSNLQGTNPVASMVCFKKGKPSKKDYRHFHIKTVTGPDDFASMREIVFRRYKRLLEEKQNLPNLVLIDGGKGQLGAACEALKELNIYGELPIIGIAKRLEEIYYPEDMFPLHIDKKSESLKLLQHLRDEAHRFAITFHRDTRSKNTFKSQLTELEGIGPKTTQKLLAEFKSIKRIKEASQEDLAAAIGPQKAENLFKQLHKSN